MARVRGVEAASVNPAALALDEAPATPSVGTGVRTRLTLSPVSVADVAGWGGRDVPRSVREAWLREVAASGGESGGAEATVTWLAARRGRLAVHLETALGVDASLTPGAAELLLFGNAGRTGQARPLLVGRSALDAWALTRAGVSVSTSRPLTLAGIPGTLAFGATVALDVGHGLLLARDAGSGVTAGDAALRVAFPRLETDGPFDPAGWGLGLDVGAAFEGEAWRLGGVLREAVSTFRWSRGRLRLRQDGAFVGPGEAPPPEGAEGASVPRALLDALGARALPTVLDLEASRSVGPALELSAGLRRRLTAGLDAGPRDGIAVTAAWRPRPRYTLRAGGGLADGRAVWSTGVEGRGAKLSGGVAVAGGIDGPEGLAVWVRVR